MALRSKGPGKSVYQKDYVKLPFDKTKDMNNNLWTTFHANAPMDFGTTMRVSNYLYTSRVIMCVFYRTITCLFPLLSRLWVLPSDLQPLTYHSAERQTIKYIYLLENAIIMVNLQRQYVDWGGSHSEATVPVQPSTISKDLPFLGRTTYGENYVKPEKEDDFGDQLRNVNKQKRE